MKTFKEYFDEMAAQPEIRVFIVMMYEGGGVHPYTEEGLVMCRVVGTFNWHKQIVPALGRLVRSLGGRARFKELGGMKKWGYSISSEDQTLWDKVKGLAKYDFNGKDFVQIWQGTSPQERGKL